MVELDIGVVKQIIELIENLGTTLFCCKGNDIDAVHVVPGVTLISFWIYISGKSRSAGK